MFNIKFNDWANRVIRRGRKKIIRRLVFIVCLLAAPLLSVTGYSSNKFQSSNHSETEYISAKRNSYDIELYTAQWVQVEFPDAPVEEDFAFALTVNQTVLNPWDGLRIGSAAPDNNIQLSNVGQIIHFHWSDGLSGVLIDPENEIISHSDGAVIESGERLILHSDLLISESQWAIELDFSCVFGQIKIEYLSSLFSANATTGVRAIAFKAHSDFNQRSSIESDNEGAGNTVSVIARSNEEANVIDSVNAGVANLAEDYSDKDLDGIPDKFDLDSDNDSVPDAVEGEIDLDGDKIPNHLDLDSDNDGILDLSERFGEGSQKQLLDSNDDGVVDSWHNVGENGLVDLLETYPDSGVLLDEEQFGGYSANSCGPFLDTDGSDGETTDGSTTDGLTAGETSAGETSAGETSAGETSAGETSAGETSAGETSAGETDAGGTTDTTAGSTTDGHTPTGEEYNPNSPPGASLSDVTAYTGVRGSGCVVSLAPVGSKDPLFLILGLFSLFILCVRRQGIRRAVLLFVTPGFIFACSTSTHNRYSTNEYSSTADDTKAQWEYVQPTRVKPSLYGAAGVGVSALDPDVAELVGHEVKDNLNPAGQLSFGFDFSKHIAGELHAAMLDKADISPSGSISYKQVGASALFYAGKARHHFQRQGISAFGRIGMGYFVNDSSAEIPQTKRNKSHVLFGVGADYMLRNGLGVRSEVISYDEDAQLAQLAILYRFGRKDRRRVAPQLAPALPDIDDDGIVDTQDECNDTKPNYSVNRDGCAHFDGIIDGVEFEFDKAILTPEAENTLDGVIQTLLEYPEANLNIAAHTDSIASETYNIKLSVRRARSVARYLVRGGVSVSRLKARGYGESQPIETNATSEGRQRNRRVEFQSVLQ